MNHALLLLSAIATVSWALPATAETEPVTLVMKGKQDKVPLDKLSQEDRDWLAKRTEEQNSRIAGLLGYPQERADFPTQELSGDGIRQRLCKPPRFRPPP